MSSGDSPRISSNKVLIVTADDFGYCLERNRGILDCYKNGIVTRASLLVNGSAVKHACELSNKFKIPIGLHLNLTEGVPVTEARCHSSLLSQDGHFLNRYLLLEAIQKGQVDENDIYLELESQIRKFQVLNNGQLPYYVDGHQHVHVFPVVRDIFCKVLNDYNIKETRLPVEHLGKCSWVDDIKNLAYLKAIVDYSIKAKNIFTFNNLKFSDKFLGLTTMSYNMSEDRIRTLLMDIYKRKDISTVVCEVMTHPGYPCIDSTKGGCGTGADDFAQSDDRRHELKVLMSPTMQAYLKNEEIVMTHTCIDY